MKDQVTTIEQSKKLIELGVPAEKASLIYATITDVQGNEYQTVMERDLVLPENIEGYAFTVADLLNLLPPEIERYELCIYYTNFVWWVAYRNTKYIIPCLSATSTTIPNECTKNNESKRAIHRRLGVRRRYGY